MRVQQRSISSSCCYRYSLYCLVLLASYQVGVCVVAVDPQQQQQQQAADDNTNTNNSNSNNNNATEMFLGLFPEEVLNNENAVEDLLQQFHDDPSVFIEIFAQVGIDLVQLGIVATLPPSVAEGEGGGEDSDHHQQQASSATTTGSNPIDDAINAFLELGIQVLGGSLPPNNNNNDAETSEPDNNNNGTTTANNNNNNNNDAWKLPEGISLFDNTQQQGVFTNLSLQEGIEDVASFFGIDSTDPDEVSHFIDDFGSCEFCDGNGPIELEYQFAGWNCSDWKMYSLFSKPEECSVLRAVAIAYCGCQPSSSSSETPDNNNNEEALSPSSTFIMNPSTTEICPLCPDYHHERKNGSIIIDEEDYEDGVVTMDQPIPSMSNALTCRDITKIPAIEGNKTCDAVAGFGYICGCPGARPQCHLCPDGSPPSLLRTNAVVNNNDEDDDEGNDNDFLTCAMVADQMTMNTKSTCSSALKDLEVQTGLSIRDYCGCPNNGSMDAIAGGGGAGGGCEPCPDGYKLRNDDNDNGNDEISLSQSFFLDTIFVDRIQKTCAEWANDEAPFMVSNHHPKCKKRQQQVRPECCVNIADEYDVMVGRNRKSYGKTSAAAATAANNSNRLFWTLGMLVVAQMIVVLVAANDWQ